jgi:hypothetical protein
MSDYDDMLPDGRSKHQLKLTSVDFLMAMLRQLGVISEGMAFRCWRKHKSKIFRY